jgi:hypothetical protein
MNLTQLSTMLEKLYNKLGNRYLTKNFITEPFEFEVKIKHDKDNDMYDYIIEVRSNPPMPEGFKYRPEVIEEMTQVMKNCFGNPSSTHGAGREAGADRRRRARHHSQNGLLKLGAKGHGPRFN